MSRIVLCLEEEAARNPALIGLPGENLASQQWLHVYTSAEQARREVITSSEVLEVWVEGSDLIAPINLAAALKRDRPDIRVCLVASRCSGSLLSRAHTASLDAVYDEKMFVHRYAAVKAALAYAPRTRRSHNASVDGSGSDRSVSQQGEVRRSNGDVCASMPASTGPLNRSQTPEGFSEATAELTRLNAQPARQLVKTAFLLTVVSGSGGAGKSTVSALAALCAQLHGLKTLLIDFDLQFGNVASFFKDAPHTPIDLLLAQPNLVAKLVPGDAVPAIVSQPRHLEDSEVISQHVASLLALVAPRFDVVVANTGASWAEEHAALLERSSKALFLVDQRSSSLAACQRALELCSRCGIATGQFLYAVNRCAKDALYTSIDVSCAMKGAESCELKEGGRDVEDYSSSGVLADLAIVGNPLYSSIEGALATFVPGIEVKNPAHGTGGKSLKWSLRRGKKGGARDDAA